MGTIVQITWDVWDLEAIQWNFCEFLPSDSRSYGPTIQGSMSHFSSAAMAFMAFSCIATGAASPKSKGRNLGAAEI